MTASRRLALAVLVGLLVPRTVPAQDASPDSDEKPAHTESVVDAEAASTATPRSERWVPPTPDAQDWDWIRLSSGEWLKGEIERLRREDFEFDSDELDDLTFDWEDVVEIRSPKPHFYRFDPDIIVTGPAIMVEDRVVVNVDGELREFHRDALVAIVHEAESEWDRWNGRISFGATVRQGNTNQTDVNTSAWVRRETAKTRLRFDYSGDFSEVNGKENANTHRLAGTDNIYLTRDLYVTPASFEYFSDPISNITARYTPGAGIGYDVFRGKVDWSIEGGAGYQHTRFRSVESGTSDTDDQAVITFSTWVDAEITKRLDLYVSYDVNLSLPTTGLTSHNAESTLSIDITDDIDLDLTLDFQRIENPRETENSNNEVTQPKSNDLRSVISLAIEF